jgi:hypothetical protein
MVRTTTRNVNPSLSRDPRDKLLATLSWLTGKFRQGRDYERAPMYFDACFEWFKALSAADEETVFTLADVMASAHNGAAESMAASLPSAPTHHIEAAGCPYGSLRQLPSMRKSRRACRPAARRRRVLSLRLSVPI